MIIYPILKERTTIGVTAPSSGVNNKLHGLLKLAIDRLRLEGFVVIPGDTAWKQHKAKSAAAVERAKELNAMVTDEKIGLIIPPWGGELLIEILEHVDFEAIRNSRKWMLGYSDTSVLLLAVTLTTGIATAHGTNLIDLRGEEWDAVTAQWLPVLKTETGGAIVQKSSQRYQSEWHFDKPSPYVFHLTEVTNWKTLTGEPASMQGRLLGGCVDVIRHLIGTPYGDVRSFQKEQIHDEPIVWYFENCELKTTDLRRTLVQMKLAGWFHNCSGLLFGRSSANQSVEGYTMEDIYHELAAEVGAPLIYDIDCGHMPPQITLVNGAYAVVQAEGGRGTVMLHFK